MSCDVLLTSDSLVDLEQYESIWNHVGELCIPQKNPLFEGMGPTFVGVLQVLNKTLQGWRFPCGDFPAISQRQMVDWIWPWKTEALHNWWVALLAPWGQGLQCEFQVISGVGFCCVLANVTVVAAPTAVARCKFKGQCYSPREYRGRWIVCKLWGERPWRGGV